MKIKAGQRYIRKTAEQMEAQGIKCSNVYDEYMPSIVTVVKQYDSWVHVHDNYGNVRMIPKQALLAPYYDYGQTGYAWDDDKDKKIKCIFLTNAPYSNLEYKVTPWKERKYFYHCRARLLQQYDIKRYAYFEPANFAEPEIKLTVDGKEIEISTETLEAIKEAIDD